jgi:hypothetical protein
LNVGLLEFLFDRFPCCSFGGIRSSRFGVGNRFPADKAGRNDKQAKDARGYFEPEVNCVPVFLALFVDEFC